MRLPDVFLPIAHIQQMREGECLAACAAMIITHLGINRSYQQLVTLLGIKPGLGAPSFNILRLQRQGIQVQYGRGTLALL